MADRLLYGIQQVGIGVTDILFAEKWYARVLGADIKILEDKKPASHMAPYMGGETRNKTAVILLNSHGGGGFELWQHTGRKPVPKSSAIAEGDLGINYILLHTTSLKAASRHLQSHNVNFSEAFMSIKFQDPFGNEIRVKQSTLERKALFTGVKGCALGVSNLSQSIRFYEKFGYQIANTSTQESIAGCDIVKMNSANRSRGRMGKYFGDNELILIERLDQSGSKIYQDRFWGDPGFIHLCFDVYNLPGWVTYFHHEGFPFTVLSNVDFKMGDAEGHWGYLEDPDETLIEMVETHKIPIVKELGISIDLTRRAPQKPLPGLLIKALSLKKVHH